MEQCAMASHCCELSARDHRVSGVTYPEFNDHFHICHLSPSKGSESLIIETSNIASETSSTTIELTEPLPDALLYLIMLQEVIFCFIQSLSPIPGSL